MSRAFAGIGRRHLNYYLTVGGGFCIIKIPILENRSAVPAQFCSHLTGSPLFFDRKQVGAPPCGGVSALKKKYSGSLKMRFYEKKCKKMRFYEIKLDIFLSYAKFLRKSLEKI